MEKFFEYKRIEKTLILSSLVSVLLYLIGLVSYGDAYFWFLNWNLFLAWLPLLFVWLLGRHLRTGRWFSWQGIIYSLLWLGFLPNSFYIASDFVHLIYTGDTLLMYYIVLLLSFTFNGFLVGFLSLYLMHKQLLKRLNASTTHLLIAGILLLCSFAIYLGRYLRWNTWDVLVNPAGILFDVTDRFINPLAHEQMFRITGLLFILLGSVYFAIWQLVQAIRDYKD
jgi:uncharacterized membrane protein